MSRTATLLCCFLATVLTQGQTYFYIDQITVVPNPATVNDNVQVQLIGNLSSTGAYVASAQASITGNVVSITVVAADNGGLTVLVPHTETINLGQLPAGDYSVAFTFNSFGILLTGPSGQGNFTVTATGDPCSDLDLVSVRWHAFTDTAIVVHVENNNLIGELFDYPNFILFDSEGDTLAKETVSFFGIAQDSWHVLHVMEGAQVATSPFDGTLELWTGFTTSLACTWDMTFDLCPPPPCVALYPAVMNLGGALITATYNWTIFDGAAEIASGQFNLYDSQQMDMDTVCLPLGNYTLNTSPTGPPVGGNPMYMMMADGGFSTEPWPVVWSLPVALELAVYSPCIEGTNGIAAHHTEDWLLRNDPTALVIQRRSGAPVGAVTITDALGRLIASANSTSNEVRIDCRPHGLLIVRAGDRSWKVLR